MRKCQHSYSLSYPACRRFQSVADKDGGAAQERCQCLQTSGMSLLPYNVPPMPRNHLQRGAAPSLITKSPAETSSDFTSLWLISIRSLRKSTPSTRMSLFSPIVTRPLRRFDSVRAYIFSVNVLPESCWDACSHVADGFFLVARHDNGILVRHLEANKCFSELLCQ